jgi:hypothetical protein
MIDTELQKQILESITKFGKAEERTIKVNTNLSDILSFSSGSVRIQPSCIRKSKLILSQPEELSNLSNLLVRCILCKRVISYPCWYYNIKYAVNHFHYFICFDSASVKSPTAKCYRKD